ncbi:MAG: RNA-guided endonuclease InsQ/TnpB family protein [Methanotrichaceae archaeon]
MKSAYKFRMYPNKVQIAELDKTLEICRNLWNTALADRKTAWDKHSESRSYEDQASSLVGEKQNNPELKKVHSQVLQDVLRRLKKAMDNFFRRVREGAKKKGYPRFKKRYASFTFPQIGFELEGTRLKLSKIPGTIRTFVHRPIEGTVKTCTIKKDGTGAWYVIFVTDQDSPPIVPADSKNVIGIDLGIKHAVTTSDGDMYDYPRYLIQAEKKQRIAQKSLHRKKRGSKNREKARKRLSRIGKRVTNLRDEFLHQTSRKLVDSADIIVFENLNIKGMLKNHHLAKHIQDVSWGKLVRFTQSKAERAGKRVVLVDPRYTSQKCSSCEKCSSCGEIVPKKLSDRTHVCPRCGLRLDRDHNAAINIRTLGLRGSACGEPTSGLEIPLSKRQFNEAGSPTP